MKKQAIVTAALTALIATGSAFAATATPGYRIFNLDGTASYTTTNPSGCNGVTFPTPINNGTNGTVTVTSDFTPGSVCSTQYISSVSKDNDCLVTIASDPASGAIEMSATQIGVSSSPCSAINDNTAVAIY